MEILRVQKFPLPFEHRNCNFLFNTLYIAINCTCSKCLISKEKKFKRPRKSIAVDQLKLSFPSHSRRFQFCTVYHRMADNPASRGLFVIPPRRSPLAQLDHLGDRSSLSPPTIPFFQATLAVLEQASHLYRYTVVSLNTATCTSVDVRADRPLREL